MKVLLQAASRCITTSLPVFLRARVEIEAAAVVLRLGELPAADGG